MEISDADAMEVSRNFNGFITLPMQGAAPRFGDTMAGPDPLKLITVVQCMHEHVSVHKYWKS